MALKKSKTTAKKKVSSTLEEKKAKAMAQVDELITSLEIPELMKKQDIVKLPEIESSPVTVVSTGEDNIVGWLEEELKKSSIQIEELNNEIKKLTAQLNTYSGNMGGYADEYGDYGDNLESFSNDGIIKLFLELQSNYLPGPSIPYPTVRILYLLNKLLEYYPFLNQYKRI